MDVERFYIAAVSLLFFFFTSSFFTILNTFSSLLRFAGGKHFLTHVKHGFCLGREEVCIHAHIKFVFFRRE
uniref:Putative secreted peptide n=1 Tax=Anopheles braziliensis TaxID=58242 RepID=A0A2M3ZU52_9DIPT